MVVEGLKITDKRGIGKAQVAGDIPPLTGSEDVSIVEIVLFPRVDEERAFVSLGWAAFADDWESPEDAVFDKLLEDADLQ